MTRQVAIVRLTSLGDVIHTLPVAAALRDHQPSTRIVWLVEEREEILLDLFGLGHFARDNVGSTKLPVRQNADRIGKNDAAVIEHLSKLRRCFPAASECEVCLSADMCGIESPEPAIESSCV